jgi:DNA replication initiation complex subunit (GINS family)
MPDPYSQLLEWRRAETSGRGLAKLPKEFYESSRRYLAETRATFESELRENPSSRKGELARQTYQRAHQIARDIIEARMTKILSQSFQAAVGGARELPNALAEERALFDALLENLSHHRRGVAPYLDPVGSSTPGPVPQPAPVAELSETPGPAPDPGPVGSRGRSPPPASYVRILKDGRPMAIGNETLEIRKEDVLSLSEETARLLIAAGVAERIRPGDSRPVT